MIPAPHRYRDTRVPTDLRRLISIAAPSLPVIAWRWRYEIVLVSGLSVSLAAAVTSFGAVPTIIAVIVMALTVLCWPPARRFAVNRAWCTITPHRVRAGCVESLIYSSRGKIPIILWTVHQPFGERILLWCRAGTSIDDFITSRAILTSACWAQDIAVLPDIRHPHLVTRDVIRRPPYNAASEHDASRTTDPPD